MNIFSFLTRSTLKPLWSFTPAGTVWRLLTGEGGRIVGEARDAAKKTASFFCLDASSGDVLWQNVRLEEPWWVGIEAVHRDAVILHGFERPSLPAHKQIHVLDAATGKELWRNIHLTFWFAYQERIIAYEQRFEKRIGHVLALNDGSVLEMYEQGIEDLFPLRQLANQENPEDVAFPEALDREWLADQLPSAVRRELEHEDVASPLEGIVTEGYLVMHHYRMAPGSTPDAARLHDVMRIIDLEKKRAVFKEILETGATASLPDSFFVKDSRVIYIKDQQTVSAIDLTASRAAD